MIQTSGRKARMIQVMVASMNLLSSARGWWQPYYLRGARYHTSVFHHENRRVGSLRRLCSTHPVCAEEDATTTPTTDDKENVSGNAMAIRKGQPDDFFVVKETLFSPLPTNWLQHIHLEETHVKRLGLSSSNVTLPVALMLMDKDSYPSLSSARKDCRKGAILIARNNTEQEEFVGRVGDRVYPGDRISQQVRMGSGYFPTMPHQQPPFELPVVYEDDHFALVNKPCGVVVYRQGSGANGLMSVRAALPFVLQPPSKGTFAVLKRPASVHRLDKPTSGLLCVVKTKPAMVHMSSQFHDRIVKKTYTAIVNGIPDEDEVHSMTSQEAAEIGVDIDPNEYSPDTRWQLIDSPLEEKHAITVWRAVRYVPSLHAHDGYLTLVELKPKTGRFHQLRQHMAQVANRPLVGDSQYDRGTESAMKFRERGLFLCASKITLEHPYYNSQEGREEWDNLNENDRVFTNGKLWLSNCDDKVMLSASLELPSKFNNLLKREENRFLKFTDDR